MSGAKGTVQLVLTADEAKAYEAFSKLHARVKEVGGELGVVSKRGDTMFNDLTGGVTKFAAGMAGAAGVTKVIADSLDLVRQRVQAIIEAQTKGAEVSKSYGEALGRVTVNMPGVSKEELSRVDRFLREQAGRSSIGEGGLIKLTDAYAQIQSAIPLAPEATKQESLRQTANLLNLVPTEDASAVALGVAKTMETSGVGGNQALNLLRMQQTLGLVKDIGPIGQGIPTLGAASKLAGVGLPDMQALAAYMTQAMGDTMGAETISAISGMTSKIMTRGTTITGKLGGQSEINGNLFERLQQISDVYQSGMLTEEEIGKLLPDLTRSEKGKMAVLGLLGGGMGKLNEYRQMMNAPSVLQGDLTAQDIGTLREIAPAQEFQAMRRELQSSTESRRAGDVEAAQETLFREQFEKRLKSRRLGDRFVSSGMDAFNSRRYLGDNVEEAMAFGESVAGLSRIPVAGRVLPMIATGESQSQALARDLTGYTGGNVFDVLFEKMFTNMRKVQDAIGSTPRRPLKETGAR